jgi:hypothetical protein
MASGFLRVIILPPKNDAAAAQDLPSKTGVFTQSICRWRRTLYPFAFGLGLVANLLWVMVLGWFLAHAVLLIL